jgi:hypothetical protein
MAVFVVAGGLGMGLTVALVTGLFLVRLLDRIRPVVDVAHLGWLHRRGGRGQVRWLVTTSAIASAISGKARSRSPDSRSLSANDPAATLTSTIGGTAP